MVLIKNSLLDKVKREVPSMLSYKIHIDKDSSFNNSTSISNLLYPLNLRLIKEEGLDNI